MTVKADAQGLKPGGRVVLYLLDGSVFSGGTLRFHGHKGSPSIWWQGNEFVAWPIVAQGFVKTGDQQPVPTIQVGNLNRSISILCETFEDMVGAKIVRYETLVKYLDAVNFPGGINPTADPTEQFPPETWYVEQKLAEIPESVQFALSSPLNFQNKQLPGRQIVANQCPSVYRSTECGYTGGPVATIADVPTADASLDQCSQKCSGCKLRFPNQPLPFGGFPAANLTTL